MKDSRHIIWTDYLDYDDWKEDLEAQYPRTFRKRAYEFDV